MGPAEQQNLVMTPKKIRQIELNEQRLLLRRLARALERNEIHVEFQHRIALSSGATTGAEARIGLLHHRRSAMLIIESLKVLPASEILNDFYSFVLKRIFSIASTWPEDQKVSLKVPLRHAASGAFCDCLESALNASLLAPRRVGLEISEEEFIAESRTEVADLIQLRNLGVDTILYEFGRAYASLGMLSSLPLKAVKLSPSVAYNLGGDIINQAIVRATVSFARILDIKVIADGVKNETGLGIARGLGCDEAQGPFFNPASFLVPSVVPQLH